MGTKIAKTIWRNVSSFFSLFKTSYKCPLLWTWLIIFFTRIPIVSRSLVFLSSYIHLIFVLLGLRTYFLRKPLLSLSFLIKYECYLVHDTEVFRVNWKRCWDPLIITIGVKCIHHSSFRILVLGPRPTDLVFGAKMGNVMTYCSPLYQLYGSLFRHSKKEKKFY